MNFPDSVTVQGKGNTTIDPDTGLPISSTDTILYQAPCAFGVLSAAELEQSWGTGTATQTQTVTASLTMPRWLTTVVKGDLQSLTFTVTGYEGTWRAVAARPGRDWVTYQLQHN